MDEPQGSQLVSSAVTRSTALPEKKLPWKSREELPIQPAGSRGAVGTAQTLPLPSQSLAALGKSFDRANPPTQHDPVAKQAARPWGRRPLLYLVTKPVASSFVGCVRDIFSVSLQSDRVNDIPLVNHACWCRGFLSEPPSSPDELSPAPCCKAVGHPTIP